MIEYEPGKWGVWFAFSCTGSVFPKSFIWAAPCAILSGFGSWFLHQEENTGFMDALDGSLLGASTLSGYTMILAFLIVFRSQQAYSRWWEGGTLMQQLRGEWFNAFSSLLAFCNPAAEKEQQVIEFQHRLIRLVSLLYAAALEQVTEIKDVHFELIDIDGFDNEALEFLQETHDRCEVCLQWIQKLIVEANGVEVIKIAPPILSRVYNQLGNGIVQLNNARKITQFPIPFPLAQMVAFMLVLHWLITCISCACVIQNPFWSAFISFLVVFSFWSINYIALELEMPFGDDANDLPLFDMQEDLNKSLIGLMDPMAMQVPSFLFQEHHMELLTREIYLDDLKSLGSHKPENKPNFRKSVVVTGSARHPTDCKPSQIAPDREPIPPQPPTAIRECSESSLPSSGPATPVTDIRGNVVSPADALPKAGSLQAPVQESQADKEAALTLPEVKRLPGHERTAESGIDFLPMELPATDQARKAIESVSLAQQDEAPIGVACSANEAESGGTQRHRSGSGSESLTPQLGEEVGSLGIRGGDAAGGASQNLTDHSFGLGNVAVGIEFGQSTGHAASLLQTSSLAALPPYDRHTLAVPGEASAPLPPPPPPPPRGPPPRLQSRVTQ